MQTLKYTRKELASIFQKLYENGIDGVIIGDTSVQLYLNYSELEGDIDLFTPEFSPLASRDVLEAVAHKYGWELSSSEVGLPALVVPVEQGYLVVEFYENYMDIEVPPQVLENYVEYRINGIRVKAVKPECYLVLKARQGTDLDKLEKYVEKLKRKGLNLKLVELVLSLYPEEEQSLIAERLRGIKLGI